MESFHLRGKGKCVQKKIISEFLWTFPAKHWIRVDIKFKVKIIILSERAIRILRKLLLATISLRVIKYDTKIRLLIIATFSFFFSYTFFCDNAWYFVYYWFELYFHINNSGKGTEYRVTNTPKDLGIFNALT